VTAEGEDSLISGAFGFCKSQTYAYVGILSGICWNRMIAYETATLFGPFQNKEKEVKFPLVNNNFLFYF